MVSINRETYSAIRLLLKRKWSRMVHHRRDQLSFLPQKMPVILAVCIEQKGTTWDSTKELQFLYSTARGNTLPRRLIVPPEYSNSMQNTIAVTCRWYHWLYLQVESFVTIHCKHDFVALDKLLAYFQQISFKQPTSLVTIVRNQWAATTLKINHKKWVNKISGRK